MGDVMDSRKYDREQLLGLHLEVAERERDEARAELSALRTEVLRAELDERVRHERADDARTSLEAMRAERDEARAGLTALVAAYEGEEGTCLGFQAAVASALVESWRAK